jgi:hypothetical protein
MGMRAQWHVHRDDDGGVYLQIELGAGYAVTLSCSSNDCNSVNLWRWNGEQPFAYATRENWDDICPPWEPEGLAAWCDEAALAHRPAPIGGYRMADLDKLQAAVEAAWKALFAVKLAAAKTGDDESYLGLKIQALGDMANDAEGELRMRMDEIRSAIEKGETS